MQILLPIISSRLQEWLHILCKIGLLHEYGKKLASNVPKLADPNVIETSSEIMNAVDKEAITVHKMLNNGLPFEVKGFIRELPNGQHPSAEKIAQAAALGIELGEHQTFVNSYIKNAA